MSKTYAQSIYWKIHFKHIFPTIALCFNTSLIPWQKFFKSYYFITILAKYFSTSCFKSSSFVEHLPPRCFLALETSASHWLQGHGCKLDVKKTADHKFIAILECDKQHTGKRYYGTKITVVNTLFLLLFSIAFLICRNVSQ